MRLQDQQLAYNEPPDTVVYEEDPHSSEKLLSDQHYQRLVYNGTIAGTDYNPVARIPAVVTTPSSGEFALVFMHRRSSLAGDRLVTLWCNAYNGEATGSGRTLYFCSVVYSLATWEIGSSRSALSQTQFPFDEDLQPGDHARVYAGQPDSSDPSRFTVQVEINGKARNLEGKLRDDGKTLLQTAN